MRHTLSAAIALALCTASLSVAAQSAASSPAAVTTQSAEVTTQLPRNARPSHYAVEITPHAEKMTFDGKVKIEVEVLEATSSITLQAANLTFGTSTLSAGKGKPLVAKVSTDADAQTATFTFNKPLKPGKYVLATNYSGVINTQANGLFALDYATDKGQQRALYTQFETPMRGASSRRGMSRTSRPPST